MKPNVLFIQVDQMHADALSIARHSYVKTPNLDRLAQNGVRFTQCYAQSPVCLPSRVCFLSGQYQKTHRQYGFVGRQTPDMPMLSKHFKQHGYSTAFFGKQHIGSIRSDWGVDRCSPSLWEDQDYAKPAGTWYGDYLKRHNQPFPTEEVHGVEYLDEPMGEGVPQGSHIRRSQAGHTRLPLEHNLESWTTRECLTYLDQEWTRANPFFIWLSYDRPHIPTALPSPWYEQIRPDEIELDALLSTEELSHRPGWTVRQYLASSSRLNMGDDATRHVLATYFTLIDLIDDQIGNVLNWLDEQNLTDQTHIVFTADHGDNAGVQGLFDKFLGVTSNAIIQIPMIWQPAANALADACTGTTVNAPVESIDLFPTLCELCNLPTPKTVEGKSLAPAFTGKTLPMNRPVFSEHYWRKTVISQRWKLVYHVQQELGELYDLKQDPYERHNRFDDPDCQPRIDDLKHQLIRFLAGAYQPEDVEQSQRILEHLHLKNKWRTWDIANDNQSPNVIDGGSTWLVQQSSMQLFYDLHARKHNLYNVHIKVDPDKLKNIIDTPVGSKVYNHLRDCLLDRLCTRIAAIDILDSPSCDPKRYTPEQLTPIIQEASIKKQ